MNLAPFSFFNVLSYDPPFVMFSAGTHEEDGGKKDSVLNVEATGEFVYNMATWAQRDQMNQTGLIIERSLDEMAVWIAVLGFDFEVLEPAEMLPYVRRLAEILTRAGAAEAQKPSG